MLIERLRQTNNGSKERKKLIVSKNKKWWIWRRDSPVETRWSQTYVKKKKE
jgi:hypothetical protein